MPPTPPVPVNCQSQIPIFDDELTLSRVVRPNGCIILCPTELENAVESWTGQVADHATPAQAIAAAPYNGTILCVGAQFSQSLRDLLVSKGYGATMHSPSNLSIYGAILLQSQIPVFDDELSL